MNQDQLKAFLLKHDLTSAELASLLGVTTQAVWQWIHGKRSVSLTVSRLVTLFDRRPELMREFV